MPGLKLDTRIMDPLMWEDSGPVDMEVELAQVQDLLEDLPREL